MSLLKYWNLFTEFTEMNLLQIYTCDSSKGWRSICHHYKLATTWSHIVSSGNLTFLLYVAYRMKLTSNETNM